MNVCKSLTAINIGQKSGAINQLREGGSKGSNPCLTAKFRSAPFDGSPGLRWSVGLRLHLGQQTEPCRLDRDLAPGTEEV